MRAHRSITLLLVVLLCGTACAACTSNDDNGGGDGTAGGAPSDAGGQSTPRTAPSSCEGSHVSLPDENDLEGVTLKIFTDPTTTTLLLTNTGSLSVAVIPPPGDSTQLAQAPYANPTDAASVEALQAVTAVANANAVPGMPAGIPLNQVYFVPPGWSVCGTTGDLSQSAQVRYLRDKASSATYFATKALADQLVKLVTPAAVAKSQSLVTCAKDTITLLTNRPAVTDIDLYTDVITGETACRSSYNDLLRDDVEAERTQSRALTWLERAPQLLEDSKIVQAIAR